MTAFTPKDYEQALIDLLPSQFKDNPELTGILRAIGSQMNIAQNDILELISAYDLNEAEGSTLDVIAGNVDLKRDGRTDRELRKAIKLRIAVNVSKGTATDLINITKAYSGANRVDLFEQGSLGSLLQVYGGEVDQDLIDVLNQAAPSAGYAFIHHDTDEFAFIPVEQGEEVSNTSGLLAEVDESFDLIFEAGSNVGNLVVNEDNLVEVDDNLFYQGEEVEYAVMVIDGVEYPDIIFAGTASDSFPAPTEAYY